MKKSKLTKNDIVEFELNQLIPIANDGFGYNHEEFPELEIIVYERWSPELKCKEPG